MIGMGDRFEGLKKGYILFILTICYIIGELGHYLIGVTSRATAKDVNYGDHACQLTNTSFNEDKFITRCESIRFVLKTQIISIHKQK
jgi:hypothetical protein